VTDVHLVPDVAILAPGSRQERPGVLFDGPVQGG
jgi:hypothetical protein